MKMKDLKNKNKLNTKKKLINNIWLYLIIFTLFVSITLVSIAFSNNEFEIIRNFWGFWLVWSLFILIFIFALIMFIRNFILTKRESNNSKKMNLIADFKKYKNYLSDKK